MDAMSAASSHFAQPQLDVVCLCAAWCGTCREYETVFAALRKSLPGHRYRWLDIDDEAELLGEVAIETFPTPLVAPQGAVLFAGPVLPRLGDVQRLLQVLQAHAGRAQTEGVADAVVLGGVHGLPADQVEAFAALARQLHLA